MALGDFQGVSCHACIGGTKLKNDIAILESNVPDIIVGTPGRVYDMITRGIFSEFHFHISRCDVEGVMLQILLTLKCLCWMKQMKCFLEVSLSKFTIFSSKYFH